MELLTSIDAAKQAVTRLVLTDGRKMPPLTQDFVIAAINEPSPVDALMKSLEALYAARAKLTNAGRIVVAQLAAFVVPNYWHGINEDNRGTRIMQAMLRDAGEAAPGNTTWPDASTDPEPKPEFDPYPPVATEPDPAPVTPEASA